MSVEEIPDNQWLLIQRETRTVAGKAKEEGRSSSSTVPTLETHAMKVGRGAGHQTEGVLVRVRDLESGAVSVVSMPGCSIGKAVDRDGQTRYTII